MSFFLRIELCSQWPSEDGYHFSHRNNRVLAPCCILAGFTDVPPAASPINGRLFGLRVRGSLQSSGDPTRSASEVSPEEFRRARPEFEAKIPPLRPLGRSLFYGKRALALHARCVRCPPGAGTFRGPSPEPRRG